MEVGRSGSDKLGPGRFLGDLVNPIRRCSGALLIVLAAPASGATAATLNANDAPAADPASQAPSPGAESESENLAKQLSNPVASLISVPFQSNYDWGGGPDGFGRQYKLNIQPVIPITLNSDWNLISRTILPVISQKYIIPVPPASDNNQVGLSDTVQSLFLSPQKPTKGGIIWGAGPVFLVPTGTNQYLTGKKWGAGPTFVVLKQAGPWTVGMLANQIWSFAGASDRQRVSSMFLQPFITYTTHTATTFSINTESTYDWVNKQWTVPMNIAIAQLLPPKKTGLSFPLQLQLGVRHYFAVPRGGPENGIRFAIIALFPKNKK
jgi:hypothetical protein